MKARIKATGEIVDIAEYSTIYAENYDTCFYPSELEFLDDQRTAGLALSISTQEWRCKD